MSLMIPTIPVRLLEPSKTNPRKHFDEEKLKELAETIRARGILEPLLVRQLDGPVNRYEIVCGERRWRAAMLVDANFMAPCIVKERHELSDREVLEIQFIENLQREDLNGVEEAEGFKGLIESGAYSARSLAAKLGKSHEYVHAKLRVLDWPVVVRESFLKGAIGEQVGHVIARAARFGWKGDLGKAVEHVAAEGLSVTEAREFFKTGSEPDGPMVVSERSEPGAAGPVIKSKIENPNPKEECSNGDLGDFVRRGQKAQAAVDVVIQQSQSVTVGDGKNGEDIEAEMVALEKEAIKSFVQGSVEGWDPILVRKVAKVLFPGDHFEEAIRARAVRKLEAKTRAECERLKAGNEEIKREISFTTKGAKGTKEQALAGREGTHLRIYEMGHSPGEKKVWGVGEGNWGGKDWCCVKAGLTRGQAESLLKREIASQRKSLNAARNAKEGKGFTTKDAKNTKVRAAKDKVSVSIVGKNDKIVDPNKHGVFTKVEEHRVTVKEVDWISMVVKVARGRLGWFSAYAFDVKGCQVGSGGTSSPVSVRKGEACNSREEAFEKAFLKMTDAIHDWPNQGSNRPLLPKVEALTPLLYEFWRTPKPTTALQKRAANNAACEEVLRRDLKARWPKKGGRARA